MAGEQQQLLTSASNWFGFAELTDDYVSSNVLPSESTSTQSTSASSNRLEDNHRSDQNEIIVPILSPQSGITKYKVLARQKAEDDIPETGKTFPHTGYNLANQGRNSIVKVITLKTSESVNSVKKNALLRNDEKSKDTLKSTKIDAVKVQSNSGKKSKVKNGKPKAKIFQTLEGITAKQNQNCLGKTGTENNDNCSAIEVRESQKREKCDNVKPEKVNVYERNSDQKQKNEVILTNAEHRQEQVSSDLSEKHDSDSDRTSKTEVCVTEERKDTVNTNCSSQGETSIYSKEHDNISKTIIEDGSLTENCGVLDRIEQRESSVEEINSNSDKEKNSVENIREEIRSESYMAENVTECMNIKSQNGECEPMDILGPDCDKPEITNVTLLNKCSVTLKRDPSIENFNKDLFDTSNPAVKLKFLKRKSIEQGNDSENKLSLSRQSSDSGGSICDLPYSVKRQKSSDDKLKLNMVYNADINVRKSGRLQSAKCASRYRGDYGIRADTYNKITSKKPELSVIDNQAVTDKDKLIRITCESVGMKGDCVDGLVAMETESVGTDFGEIIPERNDTLQEVVDHRKHRKLKYEESAIYEQNDSCPKKTQLDSQMEVNDQISLGRLVEDEFVSDKNIESDESEVNCHHIFPDSFHTSEEFKKSVENCCSMCDLSGIITKNSPVPFPLTSNTDVKYSNERGHPHEDCKDEQNPETVETTALVTEVNSSDTKTNKLDGLKASPGPIKVSSTTGYVHSVGKSVNKKQRYITKRSTNTNNDPELFSQVLSPDSSSDKCDPSQVLETLRLKLFERVGLNAQENDSKPKVFESKLISSKLKQSLSSNCYLNMLQNAQNEQKSFSDSSVNTIISSRKTPPQGSMSTSSVTILEEVAKTLDSMQKVKRKNENKVSKQKPKRRKFADKKFMLRSMSKNKENDFDITAHESEKYIRNDMLKDNSKPKQHSVENCRFETAVCTVKKDGGEMNSNNQMNNPNPSSKPLIVDDTCIDEHVVETAESLVRKKDNVGEQVESQTSVKVIRKKPKTVKCHSCFQTFRSKEVMRKHYPCRVRQTRTWSQNKLRPNRAFRSETLPRRKVVNFESKSNKSSKQNGKSRPQLLTPRKTKFRRVKGKRRRKLYQLIQDLISKRKIVEWPHLDVKFSELSFKEQCMYRLGLFCVGSKLEGLENYSAEDLANFKEHQDKEKEFFLSKNFKHIFPQSDNESVDSNDDIKLSEPVIHVCDNKAVPSFSKNPESNDICASIQADRPELFEIFPTGISEAEINGGNFICENQSCSVPCCVKENVPESNELQKLPLKDMETPQICFEVRSLFNEIMDDILHRVFLLISNDDSEKVRRDMTENVPNEVDNSTNEACNTYKGISETVSSTSDILPDHYIHIPETDSSIVSSLVIQSNVDVSEVLDVGSAEEDSSKESECMVGSILAQHVEETQTLRGGGESEEHQADVSVLHKYNSPLKINIGETTNGHTFRYDPKTLNEFSEAVDSDHINSLCDSLVGNSEKEDNRGVAYLEGDVCQNKRSEKYHEKEAGMTIGNELNMNIMQTGLTETRKNELENEEESLVSLSNDIREEIVVKEKSPICTGMKCSLETYGDDINIEHQNLGQKLSPETCLVMSSEAKGESLIISESSYKYDESIFKKEDSPLNEPDVGNTGSSFHENVLSHNCLIVESEIVVEEKSSICTGTKCGLETYGDDINIEHQNLDGQKLSCKKCHVMSSEENVGSCMILESSHINDDNIFQKEDYQLNDLDVGNTEPSLHENVLSRNCSIVEYDKKQDERKEILEKEGTLLDSLSEMHDHLNECCTEDDKCTETHENEFQVGKLAYAQKINIEYELECKDELSVPSDLLLERKGNLANSAEQNSVIKDISNIDEKVSVLFDENNTQKMSKDTESFHCNSFTGATYVNETDVNLSSPENTFPQTETNILENKVKETQNSFIGIDLHEDSINPINSSPDLELCNGIAEPSDVNETDMNSPEHRICETEMNVSYDKVKEARNSYICSDLFEESIKPINLTEDSESYPSNNITEASDVNETYMNLNSPKRTFPQTESNILKVKGNRKSFMCSDINKDCESKSVNLSNSEMHMCIANDEFCKTGVQNSESSNTAEQELYSNQANENSIDLNDTLDVAEAHFDSTDLTKQNLSKTFREKENLTSSLRADTTSLIKPDTVIRYKINGVCINENVETGVKEVASEEFLETDIHIDSSQESISESSLNGKSSCCSSEQGKCCKREGIISELETCFVKNETKIWAVQSVLAEDRRKKEGHLYQNEESTHNDSSVIPEQDISKLETSKSYEIDNSLEKSQSDKENDSDVLFVEEQDNQNLAIAKYHTKTDSDEIEVMRHGDDGYMHREESTYDSFSHNSCDILCVSLCESVDLDDQSFSSTREDLPGSFRALEKDLNISFISKPETPPVLEKEINGMLVDCQEKVCKDIETIPHDSGPPVLEPVRKPRGERHFLDIIGEICENKVEDEGKDSANMVIMSKEVNDTGTPKSSESETLMEAVIEKEDVGRHFSDVIDSSSIEKHQFNEMHMLLDKSERGEVTLAKIRSLLKEEPRKGNLIPKEKLLKIRSGVEHIIKKVKVPEKKDPSWLKRDTLLDYSNSNNVVHGFEKSLIGKESSADFVISSSDNIEERGYICPTTSDTDSSTGNITDNILQMLTSLEDKGSFADNMNNLLDILAENLGFQRSHSRTNDVMENNSKANTKTKDSQDDHSRSVKGCCKIVPEDSDEEPPSLDDIPIADAFFVDEPVTNEMLSSCNEKNGNSLFSSSSNISDQCFFREHTDQGQLAQEVLMETKIHNSDTRKAQTIFKSITELNSIETDDDSDSRETYDVAALSQRISELKYLSKDAGESDLDSDIMSDKDSSIEEVKTTDTEQLQAFISGQSNFDDNGATKLWENSNEGSDVKTSLEKLLDIHVDSDEKDTKSTHSSIEKLTGKGLINTQYSQLKNSSSEVEDMPLFENLPYNGSTEILDMNKCQSEANENEPNITKEQNKLASDNFLHVQSKEDEQTDFYLFSEKNYLKNIRADEADHSSAVVENESIDETIKPVNVELEFHKQDKDKNCPPTDILLKEKVYDKSEFDTAESKESTPLDDSTVRLHKRTIFEGVKEEFLGEKIDHFDYFNENISTSFGKIELRSRNINENDGLEKGEQFQLELQGLGFNDLTDLSQTIDTICKKPPCTPGIEEVSLDTAEKETIYLDDMKNRKIRIIEEAAVTAEEGKDKFKGRSYGQKSEGQSVVANTISSDAFESNGLNDLDPVTLTAENDTKDEQSFASRKEINENLSNVTDSHHEDDNLIEKYTFMNCLTIDKVEKKNEVLHKTNETYAKSDSSRTSHLHRKPNSLDQSGMESGLSEDEINDINLCHAEVCPDLEDKNSLKRDSANNFPVERDSLEGKPDSESSNVIMDFGACTTETEQSQITALPVSPNVVLKTSNCEEDKEEEEVTKEVSENTDETQELVVDELNRKATNFDLMDLVLTSEMISSSICSNKDITIYNREGRKGEFNTQNYDVDDELEESLSVNGLSVCTNENLIIDILGKEETEEIMENCNKMDDVPKSEDELSDRSDKSHCQLMVRRPGLTDTFNLDAESDSTKQVNQSDSDSGNSINENYRQCNSIAADAVEIEEHTGVNKAGKLIITAEIGCSNDAARADLMDDVMESVASNGLCKNFDDKSLQIKDVANKAEINIAMSGSTYKNDFENNDNEDHDVLNAAENCCTNNESSPRNCTDHSIDYLAVAENLKNSVSLTKDRVFDNPVTGESDQIEYSGTETENEIADHLETSEEEDNDSSIVYCNLPSDACTKDPTELDIKDDVQNISMESKVNIKDDVQNISLKSKAKDQSNTSKDTTEAEIAHTFSAVLNINNSDIAEIVDVGICPKDHSNKSIDLEGEDIGLMAKTLDKLSDSDIEETNSNWSAGAEMGTFSKDESVHELICDGNCDGNGFPSADYAMKKSELVYVSEDSSNTLVYDSHEMVGINGVSENRQTTFEEDTSPLKSTESFDTLHEGFCETIAEKVKRKQKERLMKLEQARDKYRCFYGETQHQKEKGKQFSIFRSTMLQKKAERAGKKEIPYRDNNHLTKLKERISSFPKDMNVPPCSVVLKPVNENKIKEKIGLKPCSVQLERLDNRTLDRYRKPLEAVEKRPPIRFKINLTKLCIKPCSPRPAYSIVGNSTEEESEGEFSDGSSENTSLRSTESENGPQISEYKVYEIKNSPRTFHKSLEEGKPIKIKVRSVPPQSSGSHQIGEYEGEKILSSVFDNATHEKVSCDHYVVKKSSSNEQSKEKFEPKWIKDLQLSESDTTELDSDTDDTVAETVNHNHSENAIKDYPVENLPIEVPDNTDTESPYQNSNSENNVCMKQTNKVTSSDSTEVCVETKNRTEFLSSEFFSGVQSNLGEKAESINQTETLIIDKKSPKREATGGILTTQNDQTTGEEHDAKTTLIDSEMSRLEDVENKLSLSKEEEDEENIKNLAKDVNVDIFCESTDGPQHTSVIDEQGLAEQQTDYVKDDENDKIDKDSENIKAVLSLENDKQTEKTISEEDEGDVIYYAVEVNDDFDTNQAISNLEELEVEQISFDPEHVALLNTEEIETSMVESMVIERLEIQESDVCENFFGINEASQILGNEEIVPVNEVEARPSDFTEMTGVAVMEQSDKFVYGIDENTQSPVELVEECVTDCTAEVQLEPEADI